MDVEAFSQAEAEGLPTFNPKTAETGKLYRWDEMSDERLLTTVQPTLVNQCGVLADVHAWEDGRRREVNAQELFLVDGYGHYSMPKFIPMSPNCWVGDLELIADDYARTAAFLRSRAETDRHHSREAPARVGAFICLHRLEYLRSRFPVSTTTYGDAAYRMTRG